MEMGDTDKIIKITFRVTSTIVVIGVNEVSIGVWTLYYTDYLLIKSAVLFVLNLHSHNVISQAYL
jgi:hypothetical protein